MVGSPFSMSSKVTAWDAKYRESSEHSATEPAAIVMELLPLLRRGTALILEGGVGRRALLLTKHGYGVTGIDASAAAWEIAENRARVAGIEAHRNTSLIRSKAPSPGSLELEHANLESVTLPGGAFDVILCVHYLQR